MLFRWNPIGTTVISPRAFHRFSIGLFRKTMKKAVLLRKRRIGIRRFLSCPAKFVKAAGLKSLLQTCIARGISRFVIFEAGTHLKVKFQHQLALTRPNRQVVDHAELLVTDAHIRGTEDRMVKGILGLQPHFETNALVRI
jgi:hypothetical protein